jgi:hypothetical protein
MDVGIRAVDVRLLIYGIQVEAEPMRVNSQTAISRKSGDLMV